MAETYNDEKKYEKDYRIFDENDKAIFIATVVLMLIAHGFCFLNIMFSHDSLTFYDTTGFWKVALGRWLYPSLLHMRQEATPWLMGVLSILYVSLSVVLVSKTFELNKVQGICVGVLFATNNTLTSLFCNYIYDADADCLALLAACFAVYAFKKFPGVFNIIVPAVSLVVCLSLYQAYICVAVGLYLLLIICEAMQSDTWKDVLSAVVTGIKELVTLILGTILYVPLMHKAAGYYGVGLSEAGNGAANLSLLKATDIINSIPSAYGYFREHFLDISDYNTESMIMINRIMIFLLIVAVIIYVFAHRRFLGGLIIIIPCIIILPIGLNAINLVSLGFIHLLMIFAFCIAYLLPMLIASKSGEVQSDNNTLSLCIRYIRNGVGIIFALAITYIGFNNIVYSNGAYEYKKLVYDNTALHAQTVWRDINNVEGYIEGETEVVFAGDLEPGVSKFVYDSSVGDRYNSEYTVSSRSAITYPETMEAYFYAILGRNTNIVYDHEVKESEEFKEMPGYPVDGYCKMIGDRVVVKLQD